jgi:hypothetical protein
MANVFDNITSNLAQLKNYYQGPIVSQFNDDVPVLRAAEKIKQGWSGFQVVRPLKVRRNQGIGATSDGGNLPSIGRQSTVQATISSKFNYLRFGITGPMIKASASDKGSFVRSAAYELEQGYADLSSDINRQVSFDGTGYLAALTANAVATTSISVQGREDNTNESGDKFLDVGMVVDIVTTGGSIVASSIEITAISTSAGIATLTLSAPVTASDGDRLIRSGSQNNEIQGLLYSLDGGTSTIYGVSRSTYPSYQGNAIDLNGGQLTLNSMQQAINEARRRGGGKTSAIWCDFDTQRYYQKLLTADKRYVNSVKGDGGFGNKDEMYLEFNGVPVVADKDCPQRMFFLQADSWKNYVLAEMEFADETGTMYIAQTSTDSLEVRVRLFNNIFNEKPSANAVLLDYISP